MGRTSATNHPRAKTHFFKSLDLNDVITPADDSSSFTATKLVCALGPSSHSVPVLESMLQAGMVGARLDLTWGGLDFHRETLRALNVAMANTKKLCAVILDTLGREVMVRRPCVYNEDGWPGHPDPLTITPGQVITLTTRLDAEATDTVLPVTYPQLHNMCEAGDTIYIGRYLVCGSDSASLYLQVREVAGQDIVCVAQNGAVMDGLMTVFHMERSSDSLLNLQNNLPLLSEYDVEAIASLGSEFEVDFISLAYTRTREDVREARSFLDSLGMSSCRVLAKVETRQALLNFRGILATADGVIVSRGNIGLDVAPEKMALVQKQLISNCNLLGKPVLITRVVDSMVTNPRPTRAEATDIANAVLDGVDGILLGAETLRGDYPVEAVGTIAQICRVAESVFDYQTHYDHLMAAAQDMEQVVKHAAREAAASSGPHHARSGAAGAAAAASGNGAATANKSVAFKTGGSDDGFEAEDTSDAVSEDAAAGDFHGLHAPVRHDSTGSFSNLQAAYQEVHAFAKYGGAGARSVAAFPTKGSSSSISERYAATGGGLNDRLPFLSKMESLAGSAVRAAGKVGADLIVVYTATGRTAQLVAKYRPPMPIITLVVPRLVNDGIKWRLEGRSTARACQLTRGLLPMLATPGPNGDHVLESAIVAAAAAGLAQPRHHVVVLQQIHDDFCVKIMSLDSSGRRVAGSLMHHGSSKRKKKMQTVGSAGALLDSDGGEDEDDGSGSEEEETLLAGLGGLPGSFLVSPSQILTTEHAKAVVASLKAGSAIKPLAVPETAAGATTAAAAAAPKSSVSPSTPSQLASS